MVKLILSFTSKVSQNLSNINNVLIHFFNLSTQFDGSSMGEIIVYSIISMGLENNHQKYAYSHLWNNKGHYNRENYAEGFLICKTNFTPKNIFFITLNTHINTSVIC